MKGLEKVDIEMFLRLLRGENVDGRPETAAESDPDGSDPHLCQNLGARKISIRFCPACGHEAKTWLI